MKAYEGYFGFIAYFFENNIYTAFAVVKIQNSYTSFLDIQILFVSEIH